MTTVTIQEVIQTVTVTDPSQTINVNDENVDVVTAGTQGAAGVAGNISHREVPSGLVNGSNVTYTLANTPTAGTEHVYLDGMLMMDGGEDYTLSGDTVTFTVAPESGMILQVTYNY